MITDQTIQLLCCGHLVNAFNGGDDCELASLKTPEARKSLDFLVSNGAKVRVKNCQRAFLAYSAPSFDPMKQFEKIHLD
jgi:hypothetical protein